MRLAGLSSPTSPPYRYPDGQPILLDSRTQHNTAGESASEAMDTHHGAHDGNATDDDEEDEEDDGFGDDFDEFEAGDADDDFGAFDEVSKVEDLSTEPLDAASSSVPEIAFVSQFDLYIPYTMHLSIVQRIQILITWNLTCSSM